METDCFASATRCDLLERYRISAWYFGAPESARAFTVNFKLGCHGRVQLLEPLPYAEFVRAMKESDVIVTDSGGVQEEAPALGKPVVVLREVTERPEAVEWGLSKLVGTDRKLIVAEVSRLFDDVTAYSRMSERRNLYGDGQAAERIVTTLRDQLPSLI